MLFILHMNNIWIVAGQQHIKVHTHIQHGAGDERESPFQPFFLGLLIPNINISRVSEPILKIKKRKFAQSRALSRETNPTSQV